MSTSNAHYRRAQQLRRVRSRRNGGGQIPLRLVICGAVFVLLVAAKLLFPEAVGRLADSARQLIGRDADFKEAFAAMGREAALSRRLMPPSSISPRSRRKSPPHRKRKIRSCRRRISLIRRR